MKDSTSESTQQEKLPSIDPRSLSPDRCCEIFNAVKLGGRNDWILQSGDVHPYSSRGRGGLQHKYHIDDARIIAAFYISRGLVEVEK